MSFAATWMDLETVILNEVSQTEKYKYHLHVESKENGTNELIYTKQKQSHRYRIQTYGYWGEDKLGYWD